MEKSYTKWSEEEKQFLKNNFGIRSYKWIGKQIQRSPQSVSIAATRLDLPYQKLRRDKPKMIETWAKMLGINYKTFLSYLYKGYIRPGKYDDVQSRRYTLDEQTVITWLKEGHVVRCTINEHTPRHIADLIREEKTKWISNKELLAIDSWIVPNNVWRFDSGMYPMSRIPLINHSNEECYYRKTDVYERLYNCGGLIPFSIKEPYVRAIRLAWESKYVRSIELNEKYTLKQYKDHPKAIKRRYYVRAEVVEWLKTKPRLAHLAKFFYQDEISYQELHADIEWKKKNNIALY